MTEGLIICSVQVVESAIHMTRGGVVADEKLKFFMIMEIL